MAPGAALAAQNNDTVALPKEPAWGYFVDTYKNNKPDNMTVNSNPAIGTLSKFLDLWTPGDSWDNGKKLNSAVLDYNIDYVAQRAQTRSKADEDAAYYTDRTNQSYGAVEGLGKLSGVYREQSGTFTSIAGIPADAATTKYSDKNDSNKAGDSNSELGKMVDLVGKVRGDYASTQQAKKFYQYMRPFRWKDESVIVPSLVAVQSSNPATDGGFPSGHTNASYLAALALAYSVPERFQELVTRASEMGDDRIVAGMHSPLDVMGGRVLATAFAASALNDPDNTELKKQAYDQAHDILLKETGTSKDRFTDYARNKSEYTQRLTYGFPQIGSTTEPVQVPKGAEVLLETRQPYLNDQQRRAVLATTGIASGYPVLDDPEGWGRLNLFAAADGYGAFNNNVTVIMDASKGGFHALDTWKNNISGTGKLTKEGNGTLMLQGNNAYSGGTEVNAGTLEGGTLSAFGTGNVVNNGGTVAENVEGQWNIEGDFTQAANGTLELNVSSTNDVLNVKGALNANGKLQVNFDNSYVPAQGMITLVSHGAHKQNGKFASVEVSGLPSQFNTEVVYQNDRIALAVTDTTNPGTAQPNPFKSGVTSQENVLKTVSEAIAATKNEQLAMSDIASHWANKNINVALKLRVVNGYENGSFRPNAPVTRAEFTAMIARAFGLVESPTANSFKDSTSSWAAGYIGALADKGIISGYADGTFKPNATISRAEMVTIIARVLDLNAIGTSAPTNFSDVKSENWAAEAIELASSANLIQGSSTSEFSPNGNSTRAEAVTIIIRALESDSSIKALIEGL
ncbi:phosphoesterase [Paenibacillus sp. PCH8]|uniref:S-layer homology domain-containing protein n=1 Tax=Paenibacillus sp. PCH8 TaxID=2066524 RepID=UPI000CF9916A|nr:phosphoesterase [Paenibacillus sp. PCH8]